MQKFQEFFQEKGNRRKVWLALAIICFAIEPLLMKQRQTAGFYGVGATLLFSGAFMELFPFFKKNFITKFLLVLILMVIFALDYFYGLALSK